MSCIMSHAWPVAKRTALYDAFTTTLRRFVIQRNSWIVMCHHMLSFLSRVTMRHHMTIIADTTHRGYRKRPSRPCTSEPSRFHHFSLAILPSLPSPQSCALHLLSACVLRASLPLKSCESRLACDCRSFALLPPTAKRCARVGGAEDLRIPRRAIPGFEGHDCRLLHPPSIETDGMRE